MYHVCESYPTVCISTESSLLERRGEEWGMSERIEIIDWFKVYVQYEGCCECAHLVLEKGRFSLLTLEGYKSATYFLQLKMENNSLHLWEFHQAVTILIYEY